MVNNPLADALQELYPHLSGRTCAKVADNITTALDTAIADGRRLDAVQIMLKGGRSTPLSIALVAARKVAKLTQGEVVTATDWSISKISRMESGEIAISVTDLRFLLELYRVTDAEVVESLVAQARTLRKLKRTR